MSLVYSAQLGVLAKELKYLVIRLIFKMQYVSIKTQSMPITVMIFIASISSSYKINVAAVLSPHVSHRGSVMIVHNLLKRCSGFISNATITENSGMPKQQIKISIKLASDSLRKLIIQLFKVTLNSMVLFLLITDQQQRFLAVMHQFS